MKGIRLSIACMVFALMIFSCALADWKESETYECDGYEYILNDKKEAGIVHFPFGKPFLVPTELDGHLVTQVLPEAWVGLDPIAFFVDPNQSYFAEIDGVLFEKETKTLVAYPIGKEGNEYVVPSGIMVIGRSAFEGCRQLSSIILPETVTMISDNAFSGCKGLTEIILPTSITTIGAYAFTGCGGLQEVTIPDGVTIIDRFAFSGCTHLEKIIMPDSVTEIGGYAFGYTRLKDVVLPKSVTKIGEYAFQWCASISNISIPETVTEIGEGAFYLCESLTSVVIPASVNTIGSGAFMFCDDLTISTIKGSYTDMYCQQNGIKCEYIPGETGATSNTDWLTN